MSGDEFVHAPPEATVKEEEIKYIILRSDQNGETAIWSSRNAEEAQRKIIELYFSEVHEKRDWKYILRERRKFTTRETLMEL